jgi:hypothetical protein
MDPEVLSSCCTRKPDPGHSQSPYDAAPFADFLFNQLSPGVMIIDQKVSVSVAIEELLLIWAVSDAEEWHNLIVDLPL